jgi:hypothetical protein
MPGLDGNPAEIGRMARLAEAWERINQAWARFSPTGPTRPPRLRIGVLTMLDHLPFNQIWAF